MRQTPGTRRYFTAEEQRRALGDCYTVLLRNADEGNPPEKRSDTERRELTPAEWARVRAVIDFIRSHPKAAKDEPLPPDAPEAPGAAQDDVDEV